MPDMNTSLPDAIAIDANGNWFLTWGEEPMWSPVPTNPHDLPEPPVKFYRLGDPVPVAVVNNPEPPAGAYSTALDRLLDTAIELIPELDDALGAQGKFGDQLFDLLAKHQRRRQMGGTQ